MMDVETIFDSDREEYEFMQERKEQPMKEQIEEMAKEICLATQKTNYSCKSMCKKQGSCAYCIVMAEALYNAGYRKQKEGEWLIPASGEPWEGRSFGMCSVCGKVDDGFIKKAHNYCPNCGAQMKGGK